MPSGVNSREDRPTHVSPQTSEDIVKALSARLPAELILAHLAELPPSYIARTPAHVIGDHITLFSRAEGRTAVEHARRGDIDEITIVASDRPGILSALAGTLAAHGVSILGGAIHTRASGHAIDALTVRRDDGIESSWDDLCADIASVLDGRTTVDESAIPTGTGGVLVATRMPTIVYVSNEPASPFTRVEVNAADRVGILYAIAKAMAGLELDIHLAQIETLGTTTVDTFYLRRSDGTRLETAEDILALRRAITSAVNALS